MDPPSATPNPLLSSQKSSEVQAVLHPLVLLTISDYITRHTLREQKGPIIGALLGQQIGRDITIEHAFECHTEQDEAVVGGWTLDEARFTLRLAQMKTVHADRGLDFVGWYTLFPKTGPTEPTLAFHQKFLQVYNESSVLLGFHPEEVDNHSVGGKLPLTIYETNLEHDDPKADQDGDDKKMEDGETTLKLKFRELPYSVETGEAEMISMDQVARGATNATAIRPKDKKKAPAAAAVAAAEVDPKGKKRLTQDAAEAQKNSADTSITEPEPDNVILSQEEQEMMTALTAKANAIKMLHARINLITTYLERLPPSFRPGEPFDADAASNAAAGDDHAEPGTTPSHRILRSIQALVNRLDLLVPSDVEAFEEEMLREQNDVALVNLLNDVLQGVQEVRSAGKKFAVVDLARNPRRGLGPDFAAASASGLFSLGPAGDLLV